jgi:hypothetical protein
MKPQRIPVARIYQRGASLMVMLVIFIIGLTTFLVGAFSLNDLKNLRTSSNSEVLAQAKDALIGRAASDANMPGSLPCPDTNDDGISEGGNTCSNGFIGRLPWKTLGLPDLRDASGERLWYVVSSNFRDNTSLTINSDTLGTITVFSPDGTQLHNGAGSNGAVALIIAPGSPLTRQDGVQQNRSGAGTTVANNYLDNSTTSIDNAVFTGTSTSTTGFIQGEAKDASGTLIVNDQILILTREQLMPVVESRIARETRTCLETYASGSGGKYPWAAPVSSASYTGSQNTLFGRIPAIINIDITTTTTPPAISTDSNYNNVNNALSALQSATNACKTSDGGSNPSNLNNAADTLMYWATHITNPPYSAAFINAAKAAAATGTISDACNHIENNSNYDSIQTNLTAASTALTNLNNPTPVTTTVPATGMSTSWSSGCFTTTAGSYWNSWLSQIFYQADGNYKPGGTGGASAITVNGSGNYRAAILLSRQPTPTQTRNFSTVNTYLEGANVHDSAGSSSAFETYRLIDKPAVNDLVLCLNGTATCP